jgi:hypothetical protein
MNLYHSSVSRTSCDQVARKSASQVAHIARGGPPPEGENIDAKHAYFAQADRALPTPGTCGSNALHPERA